MMLTRRLGGSIPSVVLPCSPLRMGLERMRAANSMPCQIHALRYAQTLYGGQEGVRRAS